MAPIPPPSPTPRIVIYYQTHHHPDSSPISLLPLITTPNVHPTHLILAAIHLNSPTNIHLNDVPPSHPRNATLWAELRVLQAAGIKVLGMLGGAAKGSFERLDSPDEVGFEAHYAILHDFIKERQLDGLDLDVEEPMSLMGIIRLIDRLKADFGPEFIITLAPVAAALMSPNPEHNLSGFDYEALEVMRGGSIAWYNTQFYCGWGDLRNSYGFEVIVARGFRPDKVVAGMVTNPGNGAGYVEFETLGEVLGGLRERFGEGFGGVMGWEYFNSLPGDRERPWEWAGWMTRVVRRGQKRPVEEEVKRKEEMEEKVMLVDEDIDVKDDALLPESFEYFTDGSIEA